MKAVKFESFDFTKTKKRCKFVLEEGLWFLVKTQSIFRRERKKEVGCEADGLQRN